MSVVRPNQIGGNTTVNEITVRTGADIDGSTLVVNDTTDKVGIGLADPKTKLTVDGTVTLKEQAAADSDTASYGQLWVKTATPNELYFTTDAGDDIQLTTGTGTPGTGDITSVVAGTGLSGGGTEGDVTLAVEASQTQITALGTIATGTWEGTAIASAYLDADTAHLSGTQTFTGAKTFSTDVTLPTNTYFAKFLAHEGDTDTRIVFFNAGDIIALEAGGVEMLRVSEGTQDEIVINDLSGDVDFRVESDDETHMLFVDCDNNRISIGDSVDAPAATLEITNNASAGAFDVPLLQLNSNDVDKVALDINAANTTADVIDLTANDLTTGAIMKLVSDSSSTSDRTLVDLTNDNTAAENTILMHIKNDAVANKGNVIIESTAAETNPLVELINGHDSADKPPMLRFNKLGHVSDDMNIGHVSFYADNDATPGEPIEYAKILVGASDVSDGDEAGQISFHVMSGGLLGTASLQEALRIGREDTVGGAGGFALMVNETNTDMHFRVKSKNDNNAIFVHATNDRVGIFKGAPHSAIHLKGSVAQDQTVQAAGSLTLDQDQGVLVANSAGGNVTFNLPAISGIQGRQYTFIKRHASNSMIIAPNGSEKIFKAASPTGGASITYTDMGSTVTLCCTSSGWVVLSEYIPT